jgi:hypothetical protein
MSSIPYLNIYSKAKLGHDKYFIAANLPSQAYTRMDTVVNQFISFQSSTHRRRNLNLTTKTEQVDKF